MKIICFGDSNTYGYDPRGYFGGRYDHPWPRLLAQKLQCSVINRGENGRQIPAGHVDLPSDTDLLIVMLGTNDLLQGASVENVCRFMEHFLQSLDPGKILLVAPPPMKPGTWVTHRKLMEDSAALCAGYQAMAQRLGIRFADSGTWDLPMAYDGVHLTEEGHRSFAQALYKELNRP